MKTPVATILFAAASVVTLPAVTLTVSNFAPNETASGGSGTGTGAFTLAIDGGAATNLPGSASDKGMAVTTYTISGIDLTSVGGTASESFIFTVTYSATTDGSTPGIARFNSFGNVSVGDITVADGDDNQVDGTETLTATISLVSSSFAGLSLEGFTAARAGGVSNGETGTFTHAGGTGSVTFANRQPSVSGDTVTLSTDNPMNFEGFRASFVAVPEPASASFLVLGVAALLRRRRSA